MVRFAQGLLEDVRTFNETSPVKLQIRLGIRMESTGVPMKIHVTENTEIDVKGKGMMKTYFL